MNKSIYLLLLTVPLALAANTDQIDYNKHDIDGEVKDIMWCGSSDEAILVLSDKGTVYRSRDKGTSWKILQSILSKSGSSVADENQEVLVKYSCTYIDRKSVNYDAESSR